MSETDLPISQKEPVSTSLEGDERWELVSRIASSAPFRKSPRLRQFLLFVTERSLSGHPEELSEYDIGWKVFERTQDYNPSDDSIVRTAARQLRVKVREYFESEGAAENWILEIPKGGYLPIFTRRESQAPARTDTPEPTVLPSKAPSVRRWKIATAALAAVAICAVFIACRLWLESQDSRLSTSSTIASTVLTQRQQPTRVVVGDFGLLMMSSLARHNFSVEEYANRSYAASIPHGAPEPITRLWNIFAGGQMTSLPDATVAGAILRIGAEDKRKVVIQHARQMSARDLRSGNFILLSGPNASPWMSLFADKLNFRWSILMKEDPPRSETAFVNTHPQAGEKTLYPAAQTAPQFGVTYGLVARVPNLTGTGKVLLVCGLRYTGLEAAGEYATDPKAAAELTRLFKVDRISELPDFEVLLETYAIDAAPRYVKVIAYRRIIN